MQWVWRVGRKTPVSCFGGARISVEGLEVRNLSHLSTPTGTQDMELDVHTHRCDTGAHRHSSPSWGSLGTREMLAQAAPSLHFLLQPVGRG